MNKLKILKNSINSTLLLSLVILICLTFALICFPLACYTLVERKDGKDIAFYSEELADCCYIDFEHPKSNLNNIYCKLEETLDMENCATTALYGNVEYEIDKIVHSYTLAFVNETVVKNLPSLGYNFTKNMPEGYREAYAPIALEDIYKVREEPYEISVYEGPYQYKQKIKIIGYTGKNYYNFGWFSSALLGTYANDFVIYDNIPPYANIKQGIMINDKTPEYYNNLGAYAITFDDLNQMLKRTTLSNNTWLSWLISILILIIVIITANYFFAADKMIKRSGVMYIYGAKRSDIIFIELIKMLILFITAFVISTFSTAILIVTHQDPTNVMVDWASYFPCAAALLAIYLACISIGFVKFAKFKPLKAISNNNTEW